MASTSGPPPPVRLTARRPGRYPRRMETNPFRARRVQEESGDFPARGDEPTAPGGGSARPGGPATSGGAGPVRWVRESVQGQIWWYRAPLLLILFWIWKDYPGDPLHTSIFDGISLGFHEAGHAAFMWSGNRFLTVAGGTLFELGIPLVAAGYLLVKQRDPFGATVCLFWMGTAFWHTAAYAGDARAQALPLVSPFGPVDVDSHDWTYMLMRVGKLSQDTEIARDFRTVARILMVGSMVAGAWVLWIMARAGRSGAARPGGGPPTEEDRLEEFLGGA